MAQTLKRKHLCASWHFHPAFLKTISQNLHKNRWMEIAIAHPEMLIILHWSDVQLLYCL